jgi:hypothetical protein
MLRSFAIGLVSFATTALLIAASTSATAGIIA